MNENNCKFYVLRKGRFCRMTVKSGREYCGEHEPGTIQLNTDETNIRIPCPLDNKHTCFASKLDKHLLVCNAKKDNLPPYIVPGINSGVENEDSRNGTEDRQLSKVPVKEILGVLSKITNLYNAYIKNKISKEFLNHDALLEELGNETYGVTTMKHLRQTSSLLGHLKHSNLLSTDTTFIEFGAGKGQLSYWVARASADLRGSAVVLIDRASHRHKLDNKLKIENENAQARTHRIRADIADLDMNRVDVIRTSPKVVGLTKHLCGVATDYALKCLMYLNRSSENVNGIIMAFCCHHRCVWADYIGKNFLLSHGFTATEFDIICGIVSWATCGSGMSREKRKEIEEREKCMDQEFDECNRNAELGLSREEKTELGKEAKLVLDYGRLQYIIAHGFTGKLCYYVESNVSPENVCLVACKEA